ncbi:MAG: 3-oxoacyl-ACP reductase FabG [Candidatus Velthaea sp.]
MRKVLVTGGSRGIGAAIASRFGELGFSVTAPARLELDLADMASVRTFIDRSDRSFDVLINNAGINEIRTLDVIDDDAWTRMRTVNVDAPFALVRAFGPAMAERGWGRIVNMSSIYGLISRAGRSMYSATKGALDGITRAAAIEFGPGGVLVNSVCPGFIDTELTRKNNTESELDALRQQVPVRRLGTVKEIAHLVGLLGSEENSYISGQSIVIDGGLLVT